MAAPKTPERRLTSLFLDMVAAERGGAANTLEAYSRDLDDLTGYLATRNRTVSSATTADLRAYLAALADRGHLDPEALAQALQDERAANAWRPVLCRVGEAAEFAGKPLAVRRVRHVVLESQAEMRYHVDGEPFAGGSRLEARIHPGALRVCA